MIIGIDISSIQYGTGVSNYTLNLVKNLAKLDKKNTYKLFFASFRNPIPKDILKLKSKTVKIIHCKIPQKILSLLWNQLHIIPIEFFIGKSDLFHTSDWTQPPTLSTNTITTVHDLTPFLYPQWSNSIIIKNHWQKMKHAIKSARHFICVSKNTQADLLKTFSSIKKSQTSVIYEACEQKYKDFSKLTKSKQAKINQKIKTKYRLNNFLLAQGTRQPRKNLDRLIKAFINFKKDYPKSNLDLAITGKYGWGQDISKTQPDYIKILGYIDEIDMVGIHASASALIFPSLYEGFGLPILKSMAVGTPVITSRNSSMSEIAGKSAILVNPKSTKDIKLAIKKIYTDKKLVSSLTKSGLATSRQFSWATTALQTLQAYSSVFGKKPFGNSTL